MKLYSCLHQLIFHSFKFNIFNPLCWHSMSDTLTSYSSPFLFHSSLKYFEGGFGKEIPNAILNGTSWDCKIPLTNIFLLLAFLYFMIFSLLSSNLLSFILVDLFLFLLSKISGCRKTRIIPRHDQGKTNILWSSVNLIASKVPLIKRLCEGGLATIIYFVLFHQLHFGSIKKVCFNKK